MEKILRGVKFYGEILSGLKNTRVGLFTVLGLIFPGIALQSSKYRVSLKNSVTFGGANFIEENNNKEEK